jgi:Zn-dependent protease with chaperone function
VAKAYQQFQARAFHSEAPNEPLDGLIFFTATVLSFRSEGQETADIRIDVPLNQLEAELEEGDDQRVILRNSAQPEWTITSCDMEVLQFNSVPALAALCEQLERHETRREWSRRTKLVVWFVIGSALVLWLGMLATGAMVRAIVAKIPPEMEQKLGKEVLDELRTELKFVEKSNQVAQLTEMAQPLLRALPATQTWQFYIVDEVDPNAFALPGGHIVVTTGMLKMVQRPEQLLGAVAHEVAHVTHKHGFRQVIASAGPFIIFQVFMGGGQMSALAGGSAFLVQQSFSQEYEKEADDMGWDYLVRANIDPRGMIEVFEKMKNDPSALLGSLVPKAFQSHPDLDKRIDRLNKKWKNLPRKTDFTELKAVSPELGRHASPYLKEPGEPSPP